MNEINEIINRLPVNGDSEKPSRLLLGNGVTAIAEGTTIRLLASDGTELFNFPNQACAFEEEPLAFLLQVYTVGYTKGRVIGKEVMKARLRDILGPEL